jgi:flagellar capping protein FliD
LARWWTLTCHWAVSATPATERIDFVQNTLGSAATIDLQNDDSNFLEATKLDSLNVVAGIDPENKQAFENVGAFSSVQSGEVVINGQQIAIDTANDSLSTTLDKINSSGAGVIATFDSASQQVLIEANETTSVVEIDSNGTNLFAALKIPEGRIDPEAASRGISRRRSYEIADAANAVFNKLNRLFNDSTFLGKGKNAGQFRAPLEAVFRAAFDGADEGYLLGFGIDTSANARLRGDFAAIDRRELTSNLQRRGNLVRDFLAGTDDQVGFVQGLLAASQQALTSVNQTLGLSGTFVDTFA